MRLRPRPRHHPTSYRPARRRNAVRYRLSVLLAALAALPLTGVAWFAVGDVRSAQGARAQAASVDASVSRLTLVIELKSRLQDERNWVSGMFILEQLGVEPATALAATGVDIPGQLERSGANVDHLVGLLGLHDLGPPLTAAREAEDLLTASTSYTAILNALSDDGQRTVEQLLLTAGHMAGSEELVQALQVLESSTVAHRAASLELTAFFGIQVAITDPAAELEAIVGQRAIRAEAEVRIRRTAHPSSQARQAMDRIDQSPASLSFNEAVAALINRALTASGGAGVHASDGLLDAISNDIDGSVAVFQASNETTQLHLALVDAARDDTLEASARLSTAAERELDRAFWSAAAMAAVTLLFAAAATRAVVRPMRLLAEVARRVSDGDATARFGDAAGSTEIRAAGRAMDAAAAHLELAEQQAKALADGDLDHEILSRPTTGQLGASLQEAVQALASSMQDREEFRRRLTHEATHDGLTQVANRNATLAQLRRGLARVDRSDDLLAVLFIDLDGFKDINDTHGHHIGDQVLRTTAHRLVSSVRDGDHVGRLGGDEFLVIAEPVSSVDEAVKLAQRLLTAVTDPVPIEQGAVSISASIGIAMSTGFHAGADSVGRDRPDGDRADNAEHADSADLLRSADLAVYKAKAEGRGRVEICDDDLRAAVKARADIERALGRAMDQRELELHYQPIVGAADGALRGFEALIRWHRPGHGMVGPDVFIPVAERSDLVLSIDRWVIAAAVRQIRAWDSQGLFPGLPVAVNMSGRHLGSPSLVTDVLAPLRDQHVDPARLILEITESALLEDLEGAAAKLEILRSHGIRVAIDDFGTGYTSLAHLRRLPIDILKIDRSYTSDESAASLVHLIINTGHLLGATITAEGIENEAQASRLTAMGSDELQGFLYGRPRPPGDLAPLAGPALVR